MPVQIRLPRFLGPLMDQLVAASGPRPGETIPLPSLNLTRRTLLYFKAEACVGCDQIDLFIGRLAATAGVDLRVIDARRGTLPDHAYGEQLVLDRGAELRRQYRVRVFPTLVLTSVAGKIEGALVGGPKDEAQISARLGLT
ncbi:TlpA family protein disulfide reductase [Deinococcus malanensis]|uniref:TlpA family protein disulfide reductase n=1 Tax=Deinococcus malanensis TaxID=1706855 RepID=UPI00363982C9